MAEKKKAAAPRARKKKVEIVEEVVVTAAPVETVSDAPVDDAAPAALDHDVVAQRAFEIWRAHGGGAFDNWIRAEQELRTGM